MRKHQRQTLDQIFRSQLENLAITLRPKTMEQYHWVAKRFLGYLRTCYPEVHKPSQLSRDPHILGWLRSLYQQQPPLANGTRAQLIVRLRRLLNDLALSSNDSLREELIIREDFPPKDHYLPKPISPEDDRLLDHELRGNGDLYSNALLLIRATGIRLGECANLSADCLRHLGPGQWALRVPLGKLHNERWVPVDDDIREILARILSLKSPLLDAPLSGFLLPQPSKRSSLRHALQIALTRSAQQAHCSAHITPHQLRHTYATEMLRAGVSLPAIKELLGHRSINMTMRYVQVSQNDLQQQYHQARHKMAQLHAIPKLQSSNIKDTEIRAGIPAIRQSLGEASHLIEMYRRQLTDQHIRRKLERLANRLVKISTELHRLGGATT